MNDAARLLIVALPLYFTWEMLQMPAFTALPASWLLRTLVCAVAALGDGVMALLLLGLGRVLFRDRCWFSPPRLGRYAVIIAAAVVMQVVVERVAVEHLDLWRYAASHPRLPWIGTGIVPIAQAIVIPPVSFGLVAAWLRRGRGAIDPAAVTPPGRAASPRTPRA